MKVVKATKETIELEDGRVLKRPSGKKTILPTREFQTYRDYWGDSCYATNYMGESWEFTGKILYKSNEGWDEVLVSLEIVEVYEDESFWWFLEPTVTAVVSWIDVENFHTEYATIDTVVDCTNAN